MIGSLRGIIKLKSPPVLLLEVGGVGYEVEAPMSTFYDLPEVGKEAMLYTHFVVRDDAQLLYGFGTLRDRDLFRHVLKVNGVGPRMGLAILSAMSTDDFLVCVASEDVASMTRIPGVGKKTAERLLLDLRDRLEGFDTLSAADTGKGAVQVEIAPDSNRDAVSALVALGYKPAEATKVVRSVKGEGLSTEELIREALRFLGSDVK